MARRRRPTRAGLRAAMILGRAKPTYIQKVVRSAPFGYWPLLESSGTTVHCLMNPAQNGTYSSDVSTWPVGDGIGDGNTAPYFDGTNDYINVISAALTAAFNGLTGSLMIWGKVASGAWADAQDREYCWFQADGSNLAYFRKTATSNQHRWRRASGGTGSLYNRTESTLDWHCMQMTWAGGFTNSYLDGELVSGPTALGTWAGSVSSCYIGVYNSTPTDPWHGALGHCALWDRALPQPELRHLALVER